MPFHLSSFVTRFDLVCQQKFGRTYDLTALETSFCDHASGRRHLTAKDVGKLFNAEKTPYGKYWPRPHMKTLEESLREKRIYLGLAGTNRSRVTGCRFNISAAVAAEIRGSNWRKLTLGVVPGRMR